MRGNRPKSNALCQTRLCAVMVAVATLMGISPCASASSLYSSGMDIRAERLEKLWPVVEHANNELKDKSDSYKKSITLIMSELPVHDAIEKIKDDVELKDELKNRLESIDKDISVVKDRIDNDKKLPKDDELHGQLSALRGEVNTLMSATNSTDSDSQRDLRNILNDHTDEFKRAAENVGIAEKAVAAVSYREQRWQNADNEAAASELARTKELNASATDAEYAPGDGKYLTWNDKNQIDFMTNDDPQGGQDLIAENTILELSNRSGPLSDAISGTTDKKRDVGTIRAMHGADHTVRVDDGMLAVHQGIDGDGTLTVAVGTNGVLNFEEGKGVDENSAGISLSAGLTDGKAPQPNDNGGIINFKAGTSAGGAKIAVGDHGVLVFSENSDAGHSAIVVGNNGAALFNNADVGRASITNDGELELSNGKGDDWKIENRSDGKLLAKDTFLDGLRLKNAGVAMLSGATTANKAHIELDDGTLTLADATLMAADAAPTDKSLTIGALTGTGHVVTAGKRLNLGALNENDVFGGSIASGSSDGPGANVTKIGTGNLTFSGDQSGIDTLTVDNGTLTAAHENALGTGLLALGGAGTITLANDVHGVKRFENAGTLKLHGYRLIIDSYESTGDKAKIESEAKKDADGIHRGTIEVNESGDFTKTKIVLSPVDESVTPKELLEKKIQVVVPGPKADVKLGEVEYGVIPTDPTDPTQPTEPTDPTNPGGGDDGTVVIDPNKEIAFLDPDAAYSGNEQELLDSLNGITLNDMLSGKVGGSVLGQLVLLPAGSAEQRRAARMLSGESLVNNAAAAYSASDAFRNSMQTRMLAGGSMLADIASKGQRVADDGTAVWGSFKGADASQSADGMGFSVKGVDGAFGVDRRVNANTLVGASFGVGSRTSSADDLPGDASIRSVSLGMYGSYLDDAKWFASGGVFFTNHSVTTERTVAARNVSAHVSGKTSGRTFGVFGEIGQRVYANGMNVDPFVGMRIASTRLNAYDETDRDAGQGNNGLRVGSQAQNSRRAIVGVRLWGELANAAGGSVAPSLRLAYEHEFGDTQSSLTNAIYGAPRGFTVRGVSLGRDIFTTDLGADIRVNKQFDVHVGGNLSLRSGETSLAGGVAAKYRF